MPDRTPRERAAALRAGARSLSRVGDELRQAGLHFEGAGRPDWSDRLYDLYRDLAALATHARNEAERLEAES